MDIYLHPIKIHINMFTTIGRSIPRRHYSVKFPQTSAPAPTVGQFRNPLLHCFLLASSTYIVLHTVWLSLEYEHREKELKKSTELLESRIQTYVDARSTADKSKKWWKFW
ncbi:hypothetical protein CAAN1_06S03070 [[Candida] anglica]|uniref:Uncharacterized protein n=1 Tax=[Candida] anglica TaxID=148631 RepID=A0ABP0ELR6_9ASCO